MSKGDVIASLIALVSAIIAFLSMQKAKEANRLSHEANRLAKAAQESSDTHHHENVRLRLLGAPAESRSHCLSASGTWTYYRILADPTLRRDVDGVLRDLEGNLSEIVRLEDEFKSLSFRTRTPHDLTNDESAAERLRQTAMQKAKAAVQALDLLRAERQSESSG